MVNSEKKNGLNNLKTIHKIQVGGELQDLLRDIRSSKSSLDTLIKNVSKTKNEQLEIQAKLKYCLGERFGNSLFENFSFETFNTSNTRGLNFNNQTPKPYRC